MPSRQDPPTPPDRRPESGPPQYYPQQPEQQSASPGTVPGRDDAGRDITPPGFVDAFVHALGVSQRMTPEELARAEDAYWRAHPVDPILRGDGPPVDLSEVVMRGIQRDPVLRAMWAGDEEAVEQAFLKEWEEEQEATRRPAQQPEVAAKAPVQSTEGQDDIDPGVLDDRRLPIYAFPPRVFARLRATARETLRRSSSGQGGDA